MVYREPGTHQTIDNADGTGQDEILRFYYPIVLLHFIFMYSCIRSVLYFVDRKFSFVHNFGISNIECVQCCIMHLHSLFAFQRIFLRKENLIYFICIGATAVHHQIRCGFKTQNPSIRNVKFIRYGLSERI